MSDGITLKGDFQGDFADVVGWFFGFAARPTKREWWLVAYTRGGCPHAWRRWSCCWRFASRLRQVLRRFSPVVALAIAAAIAERQSVRLSDRAWISVSALPIVLAAVIYGPLAAICVSVASLVPSFGPPYARWATWTSTRSIAAGLAGVVALAFEASPNNTFGWLFLTAATVMAVEQFTDLLLGSVVARSERHPRQRNGAQRQHHVPRHAPLRPGHSSSRLRV